MLPESFTPARRLIMLSKKSPMVPNTTTMTAKTTHSVASSHEKYIDRMHAAATAKINPPKNPSNDFFGEMEGWILCLPNSEPAKYATVSLGQINMITPSGTDA